MFKTAARTILLVTAVQWSKTSPCFQGLSASVHQKGKSGRGYCPLEQSVSQWKSWGMCQWSNPERQDMSFTLFVMRVLPVYWYCKVSIAMLSFNSSTDLSTLHWDFSNDFMMVVVQYRLILFTKSENKLFELFFF